MFACERSKIKRCNVVSVCKHVVSFLWSFFYVPEIYHTIQNQKISVGAMDHESRAKNEANSNCYKVMERKAMLGQCHMWSLKGTKNCSW